MLLGGFGYIQWRPGKVFAFPEEIKLNGPRFRLFIWDPENLGNYWISTFFLILRICIHLFNPNIWNLFGKYLPFPLNITLNTQQIDKLKKPMTLTQFLNNTTLLTTISQMTLLLTNLPIESDCF